MTTLLKKSGGLHSDGLLKITGSKIIENVTIYTQAKLKKNIEL